MSVKKNIEFHIQETWRINFTTHESDGSIMALPSGVAVLFRINDGSTIKITKELGDGITITDEPGGAGSIVITPGDQIAASIKKGKTYQYELKVVVGSIVSIQNIGDLKVLPSLFATV